MEYVNAEVPEVKDVSGKDSEQAELTIEDREDSAKQTPLEKIKESSGVDSRSLESNSVDNQPSPMQEDESESNSDTTSESVADFSKLRNEAIQSSTNDPTIIQREYDTQTYDRSDKIREYVLRRAEGRCEGCGKPAPFASTSGEPYLHAHHVYELSDGGPDRVDTVVALCPNCHYRVHHGSDGREYNNKLIEKVQNLESEIEQKEE